LRLSQVSSTAMVAGVALLVAGVVLLVASFVPIPYVEVTPAGGDEDHVHPQPGNGQQGFVG
jgi:hypothetical protein